MWFLILKLLKVGYSQAQKHRANKANGNNTANNPNDINLDSTKAGTTTTATEMYTMGLSNENGNTVRNPLKTTLDALLRTLQFSLGIAVIALYGPDLHDQHSSTSTAIDSRWLYAVITASLSSLTALFYLTTMLLLRHRTPLVRRGAWILPLFVWEGVLWLLWLVVFGIFGKVFIPCQGLHGHESMWRAVWVDLVAWGVEWVVVGWAGLRWWRGRQGGSLGMGQGKMGGDAEKGEGA